MTCDYRNAKVVSQDAIEMSSLLELIEQEQKSLDDAKYDYPDSDYSVRPAKQLGKEYEAFLGIQPAVEMVDNKTGEIVEIYYLIDCDGDGNGEFEILMPHEIDDEGIDW